MMKLKNALARTALSAFLVISGSAVADDNEIDGQETTKAEKAFEKVEKEAEKAQKKADKKAEKDARKAEKEAKKADKAKSDAG